MMDEDAMDLPPEDLPRRVLSDFAVYNSEGFCASLELLPMWSGVDPDVDLYASGNVLDDDGEWAGGQSLAAGKPLALLTRQPTSLACRRREAANRNAEAHAQRSPCSSSLQLAIFSSTAVWFAHDMWAHACKQG